jgi:hypothetical protein
MLTGDEIVSNLTVFLYQTPVLPALPQAIHDVSAGDYALMTQLSGTKLAMLSAISRGMMYSVLCAEDLIGRTPDDLKANVEQLAPELVSRTSWEVTVQYGIFGICRAWPVAQLDASFKTALVSDLPALVLSGEYDPVTPSKWGRLLATNLRNGHFFEFPGIGHSVGMASECARSVTRAFLADPTQAPEASCVAEMTGIDFDVPSDELAVVVLEPFSNAVMGVRGVLPRGWAEVAPRNYMRQASGLDQTLLALDAVPASADELRVGLAGQLGFDPQLAPASRVTHDELEWSLYTFEISSLAADLAIAQGSDAAYFVLLISDPEERTALYDQVFVPMVEAFTPQE